MPAPFLYSESGPPSRPLTSSAATRAMPPTRRRHPSPSPSPQVAAAPAAARWPSLVSILTFTSVSHLSDPFLGAALLASQSSRASPKGKERASLSLSPAKQRLPASVLLPMTSSIVSLTKKLHPSIRTSQPIRPTKKTGRRANAVFDDDSPDEDDAKPPAPGGAPPLSHSLLLLPCAIGRQAEALL